MAATRARNMVNRVGQALHADTPLTNLGPQLREVDSCQPPE